MLDSERERVPLLQLRDVNYSEQGLGVLKNINFDLMPGEIHAVVGEHRVGKTPLAQIAAGELRRDSGTFAIKGKVVENMNPQTALKLKIGVVHQEAQIIPNLTAVENIVAGTMPPGRIKTPYFAREAARCREILASLEREINLQLPMSALTPTDHPLVEIARLIYLDCDIFILDDVGMRLTPREMKRVLDYLRRVRGEGKGILFIDSDVDNVLAIADRVTFLHNGFLRGTEYVKDLDRLKLLKLTYNFALSWDGERESGDSDGEKLAMGGVNEELIANLPAGVLVFDSQGKLQSMNQMAREILNLTFPEVENGGVRELLELGKLTRGEEVAEALLAGESKTWDRLTMRESQSVKVRTLPCQDEKGTSWGRMILLEDVTMDSAVKEYLTRAERISSMAQLAAGVSHEINNPLGIIHNYLHALTYSKMEEDVREKLDKIGVQLERIKEITGSLLSFSRPQKQGDQQVDLVPLIQEVLLLLNHRIRKKSVSVKKELPSSLIVPGAGNRLRQVFVNLLNNSIEAVREGGRLEVGLKRTGGYGEVLIKDNGVGIPPELREDIFNPFFSTKLTKENAGMGLSICQHIIESHQGMVTFESKPGNETIFQIRLPLKTPLEDQNPREKAVLS